MKKFVLVITSLFVYSLCLAADLDYDYKNLIGKLDVADEVKNSAYEIIKRKKATYYGIAMSVRRICEAIVRNEKSILPISSMMNGEYGISNVALSMPAIVGKNGVETHVPLEINEQETANLQKSAKTLQEILSQNEI